nr:MAG: RNA-dependent RNA polymerase [Army ant associated dicistrovirus 7]
MTFSSSQLHNFLTGFIGNDSRLSNGITISTAKRFLKPFFDVYIDTDGDLYFDKYLPKYTIYNIPNTNVNFYRGGYGIDNDSGLSFDFGIDDTLLNHYVFNHLTEFNWNVKADTDKSYHQCLSELLVTSPLPEDLIAQAYREPRLPVNLSLQLIESHFLTPKINNESHFYYDINDFMRSFNIVIPNSCKNFIDSKLFITQSLRSTDVWSAAISQCLDGSVEAMRGVLFSDMSVILPHCQTSFSLFESLIETHATEFERISEMDLTEIIKLTLPQAQAFVDFKLFNIDFSSIKTCIESLVNTVEGAISSSCNLIRDTLISLVICIIIGFCIVFSKYAGTKAALGLCLAILAFYLRSDLMETVRNILSQYSGQQPVTQSGFESFGLLVKLFSCICFKVPSISKLDKVMKAVGSFPRFISGLETIATLFVEAYTCARSFFYKHVLGTPYIESHISPVNIFINKTVELYDKYNLSELSFDDVNYNVVMGVYKDGNALLQSPLHKSESHNIVRTLNLLSTIITEFRNRGFSHSSIRNPPVVVYLSGGTGVGKSTITYPLSVDILKEISTDLKNLKENWRKCIYTRNCEQEFWDGYTGQLVCVYDDFSQRRDTAQNPNPELFEIVRCANDFPYPLHMANLNDKQNTFFSSKILLCSSNIAPQHLKTESLNYSEALLRRFDLNVIVKLKTGITTEILSAKKAFDPTVYEFDRLDIKGNFIEKLSYSQLVGKIASIYSERSGFVDSIAAYIDQSFPEAEVGFGLKDKCQAIGNYFQEKFYDAEDALIDYTRPTLNTLRNTLMTESLRLQRRWNKTYTNLCNSYPILKYGKIILMTIGLIAAGLGISTMFKKTEKPKNVISFVETDHLEVESGEKLSVRQNVHSESGEKVAVRQQLRTESNEKVIVRQQMRSETSDILLVDGVPIEQTPESQGVYDLNASEILGKIIKRNLYGMYIPGIRLGHGIFVKGNVMMYPTHFLAVIKHKLQTDKDLILTLKSPFINRPTWEMYARDFLRESKSFANNSFTTDISMCAIQEAWTHNDLTTAFVTKQEVASVIGSPAMMPMIMCDSVNDNPFGIIKFTSSESMLRHKEGLTYVDPFNTQIKLRSGWEYMLDTVKGDCGAPLILRNPRVKGKVCGIHVAGLSDGRGFASPVTREFILDCLAQFSFEDLTTMELRSEIKTQSGVDKSWFNGEKFVLNDDLVVPGEFLKIGTAKAVPSPSISQITPSVVYGDLTTPKTKTTLLFPTKVNGELIDPMRTRMKKYGRKNTPIDHDLINNSFNALRQDLISLIHKRKIDLTEYKSLYDFETAMRGVEGDETINSVKRKSSPGFPWVFKTKKVGKRDFFGEDGEFDFDSPLCQELKTEVDLVITNARNGIRMSHVFTDLLKDERKPAEKFMNTRAFSGCPLEYLAVCKQFFQGAVSILTKLKNESHISVGTNVYSPDWDFMVRYLRRYSDYVLAGDFEGFDSSQMVIILRKAGKILNEISKLLPDYEPWHDDVRNVLLQSLWHSIHLNGSDILMWGHALPSGHYLTAIINSIYVNLLFCSAFILIMEEVLMKARSILAVKFFEECGLVAYGDDHVASVPKKFLEYFNQHTLEAVFLKLGIGYTSEDKGSFELPYRHFTEVSYLKRKMVLDESRQRYIAPITLDTILETPMWVHRSDDPVEAMKCNMEFSLRELSLHDENTWNKWAPKMHDLLLKHGKTTIFMDYQDTRAFVLDPQLW